jgi:hypothetical protein
VPLLLELLVLVLELAPLVELLLLDPFPLVVDCPELLFPWLVPPLALLEVLDVPLSEPPP